MTSRLRQLLAAAPADGSLLLPVRWLREELEGEGDRAPAPDPATLAPTWRERLWSAPDDALLGVSEIAEALGRPVSWCYRRTGRRAIKGQELPTSKLGGELVCSAGALRRWIRDQLEPDTVDIRGRRRA